MVGGRGHVISKTVLLKIQVQMFVCVCVSDLGLAWCYRGASRASVCEQPCVLLQISRLYYCHQPPAWQILLLHFSSLSLCPPPFPPFLPLSVVVLHASPYAPPHSLSIIALFPLPSVVFLLSFLPTHPYSSSLFPVLRLHPPSLRCDESVDGG